jgi:23S rRNA (cytosine1962-C5)-methyltransferase
LDPPAFAKKRGHLEQAAQGYRQINAMAMRALPPGGLLLTCSCSYYMDEERFQEVVFKAARDVGREAKILQYHRLAMDHPVSLYHPEGRYLKSLVLEMS